MAARDMASELEERVDQLVAGLADEATSYLTEKLGDLVDELVRDRLEGIVAQLGGVAAAKPSRKATAKPARTPKVTRPKAPATGPRCRTCGKSGHNARTCGKAAEASEDDDEDEGDGAREVRRAVIREHSTPALDTRTVPVASGATCPHGGGSPASCSQCVLGGAKVRTVSIVGGQVVVDGRAIESARDHELAHNRGYKGGQKRKAA